MNWSYVNKDSSFIIIIIIIIRFHTRPSHSGWSIAGRTISEYYPILKIDLLEQLEHAISHALIPVIRGDTRTPTEGTPIRMGGLGITNPCHIAASEYEASTATTEPIVEQIVLHTQELPGDCAIRSHRNVTYRKWKMPFLNKLRELQT